MLGINIVLFGAYILYMSAREYKLFDQDNMRIYEDFLNPITSDTQGWLATARQLATEVDRHDIS